jgi:uncharacterized protein (DUF1501 family)
MTTRRSFIKTLGATSLAMQAPLFGFRSLAHASQQNPDQFFVFIRVPFGWDVTLSLDPQIHKNGSTQEDMFIEYSADKILSHKNLRLGPALAPLKSHFNDIATVNGILMNTTDNGHDASLNYISTGDGSGKAASLPLEVAHASTAGPLGVVFTGSLTRANRSVISTSTASVLNIKNVASLQAFQGFLGNVGRASDLSDAMSTLMNNKPVTDALTNYLISNDGQIQNASSEEARAAQIIAGCFLAGASQSAQIDFTLFGLDSHSDHEKNHLEAQTSAWTNVAEIFSIFKNLQYKNTGKSLFDMTTFAVVSEFSRTPALNASKGKDHNPLTNSVLLAGKNIVGGETVGASRLISRQQSKTNQSKHVSLPIDYTTGDVATTRKQADLANFNYITPDRVVGTIASAIGVDVNRFKSVDMTLPILPKVIKT